MGGNSRELAVSASRTIHMLNTSFSLQVNHLSTALTSFLLLPNMVKAAEQHKSHSRLVVVCSEVHHWARLEKVIDSPNVLQALNDKEYCKPENGLAHRYPDTKRM